MTDTADARVAVYIDFDNIVISRYDQVHGRSQFQRDRARNAGPDGPSGGSAGEADARLRAATVDIGSILDFAASFGTLVLTRAYADWSAPINAEYRGQRVSRAVDLVQLFPAAAYAKNGADIRLAVDAVEDMFRLPDLSHVVIVAGDSDYVPLAQRCKRLGRYVVGIGVAGSTARSLAAACDEFVSYDDLPGSSGLPQPATGRPAGSAPPADRTESSSAGSPEQAGSTEQTGSTQQAGSTEQTGSTEQAGSVEPATGTKRTRRATPGRRADPKPVPDRDGAPGIEHPDEASETDEPAEDPQGEASRLLARALRVVHQRDDADWLHSSVVKSQMKRMDPSFSEKALGFRSFSDFVTSRDDLAELDESGTARLIRLRPDIPAG